MRVLSLFILSTAIITFLGCGSGAPVNPPSPMPTAQSQRLESEAAWEKIKAGAVLVDARTVEEYAAGHLEGAINIPYDTMVNRWSELPKDKEIVVYCRTGRRAGVALDVLKSHGYKKIFNAGGISDLQPPRSS